jgi:hypothetical protein
VSADDDLDPGERFERRLLWRELLVVLAVALVIVLRIVLW